jgi:hypothetical protein
VIAEILAAGFAPFVVLALAGLDQLWLAHRRGLERLRRAR